MSAESPWRFTTGQGSALLYFGDEFVAKFSSRHVKALSAVLVANEIMREDYDVLVRTNAGHMDELQKAFDQVKELAGERDVLAKQLKLVERAGRV